MSVVLFAVSSLVLLILVSGGYTFFVACGRRKDFPWFDEQEIKKTSYGKHYDYLLAGDKFMKEHNAQPVYMESFDGTKLHAMWIPAEKPKGTVLMAHGYRSNKLLDFGLAFDLYHNLGMNILVPDQRGNGKSGGKYITFGVKESRDVACWIAYHNKTFGKYELVLSGLSMGASTMLYLADQDLPANVKGIIADCGFTSAKDIISVVFRRVVHLPPMASVWVADLFARLFAGFSLTEKDTRKTLKNSKLPVFMVHGVEDGYVPCEMTEEGYAACTSPKQLLLVEGADHGTSFVVDREKYLECILSFLKANVTGFQEV